VPSRNVLVRNDVGMGGAAEPPRIVRPEIPELPPRGCRSVLGRVRKILDIEVMGPRQGSISKQPMTVFPEI